MEGAFSFGFCDFIDIKDGISVTPAIVSEPLVCDTEPGKTSSVELVLPSSKFATPFVELLIFTKNELVDYLKCVGFSDLPDFISVMSKIQEIPSTNLINRTNEKAILVFDNSAMEMNDLA